MEVILLRHGQSEANAGLTDFLDSHLTALGREQARRTAERLHGMEVTRAYVSPLRRTLETIRPYCEATDQPAEVYADVCEYFSANYPDYQRFPGLSPAEIQEQFPFAFFGGTFPCSEAWWPQEFEDDERMYARAVRVREALYRLHFGSEERLLIVSHAETVGRLIEAFRRVPPNPDDPPWSDNCALTGFGFESDPEAPATLLFQNDTSHLAGLASDATG